MRSSPFATLALWLSVAVGPALFAGCGGADVQNDALFAKHEGKSRCTIELDISGMT